MNLVIAEAHLAAIRRRAEQSYPGECCGFLLGWHSGEDRRVLRMREAVNEGGEARFAVSPRDTLAAEREAERLGMEVVGLYHSHPDAESVPSRLDREHALPGWSYLIVSVREGRTGATAAWSLRADRSGFDPDRLASEGSASEPTGEEPTGEEPAGEERAAPELTDEERVRYSRHMVMPEIGEAGQTRLTSSSVAVVGMGGLGSPVVLYLAAAGVGRLGLVDFDTVSLSNLQRQVIHGTGDMGRSKVESARDRIAEINPGVAVETHDIRLTSENAMRILRDYDVVVDASDNFPTRYRINDACVLLGKPLVYGSVFRFEGQVSVFDARTGPCYRCLYPEPPPPGLVPSCAEGGVLGVLPGIVGAIQAAEAVKLLLGIGRPLVGQLLLVDGLAMEFRRLRIEKDPGCPICGESPVIRQLADTDASCGPGRDAVTDLPRMSATELAARRDEVQIIDVREPFEARIAFLPDARLIPLRELAERVGELDRDAETVLLCRSGVKSAAAVRLLLEAGFRKVWNLEGGILAWADQVDPTVRKY